jgi:catechol 2,3-dioxygenase
MFIKLGKICLGRNIKMSLPNDLSLGVVQLTVGDLERSVGFYERSLGLKVHQREAGSTVMGAEGGVDLLELKEIKGAKKYGRTTGLYHFAILVPSRLELARFLRNLAETQTPVEGFSDHLVSEAIYLSDVDGNGIEVYRDRPRTDWVDKQGKFRMGTDPLDLDDVLTELETHPEPWTGMDKGTVMGHVHLHVRDIPEALKFYGEVVGFDLMMNMGSALFVSAGGYHHHLGLNVWAGVGAPPPPENSVGIRHFIVNIPGQAEVDKVLGRLRAAQVTVDEHDSGYFFRDPSQNGIVIRPR